MTVEIEVRGARSGVRFWGLAYALVMLLAGTNLATPLYGLYQESFGFSSAMLTVIFAVYVGTLIPSLLLLGPLADALGRRRVLIPAVVVAGVGAVVFAVADSIATLLIARAIQGVAVGAASGALTAALSDCEPRGNQRRASLVAATATVGGIGVGPLIGGVLAAFTPWPLRMPFIFELGALTVALAAVSLLPKSGRQASGWRPTVPHIPATGRGKFWTSSLATFLGNGVTGLFLTLVPSYTQTLLGRSSLVVAGAMAALLIAASVLAQLLGFGKISPRSQRPGLILLGVGLVAMAASGHWGLLSLLLAATVTAGVGQGIVFLGALTEVNMLAPADQKASVVSAFYVMVYLGLAIPVIGAGILATQIGLLGSVQVFSILVALCCFAMASSIRPRRARATA